VAGFGRAVYNLIDDSFMPSVSCWVRRSISPETGRVFRRISMIVRREARSGCSKFTF
jgi:hypothetical protein